MVNTNNEMIIAKNRLAKDIVGEIVMSESPEAVIKKWRNMFRISQKDLAKELEITSSVISDYESGRRASPGIRVIKKYVEALLDIDQSRGGIVIRSFSGPMESAPASDAIIDIREFTKPISVGEFCRQISAPLVFGDKNKNIYGYTMVDSLKAITEFSFHELARIYGNTSQKALIFTKVQTGRTPMVAIKLTSIRPGLVVLHGLDSADDIAKRIAELENIPLAVCRIDSADGVVDRLRKIRG